MKIVDNGISNGYLPINCYQTAFKEVDKNNQIEFREDVFWEYPDSLFDLLTFCVQQEEAAHSLNLGHLLGSLDFLQLENINLPRILQRPCG